MYDALLWSCFLLGVGFFLLVCEFFIPSAGAIAAACAVSLIAGVVVAFTHSVLWGVASLTLVVTAVPLTLAIMIRWWPYTPIGRRMLLRSPDDPPPDVLPNDPHHQKLQSLVGRVGQAESDLMPNGMIEVDGERFDAISVSGLIHRGQRIEVVRCIAGKLNVRTTTRLPESSRSDSDQNSDQAISPLDRPIDQLGLSDLDDPLA